MAVIATTESWLTSINKPAEVASGVGYIFSVAYCWETGPTPIMNNPNRNVVAISGTYPFM